MELIKVFQKETKKYAHIGISKAFIRLDVFYQHIHGLNAKGSQIRRSTNLKNVCAAMHIYRIDMPRMAIREYQN
jgi:hypothetical protein